MLCYRYSRSATDVIHDTILWFTINRRCMRRISIVTLLLCVPSMILFIDSYKFKYLKDIQTFENISTLFDVYPPGYSASYTAGCTETIVYMSVISVVLCLLFFPLLTRYFLEQRSLRDFTLPRILDTITRPALHTCAASAVMGLVSYVVMAQGFLLGLTVAIIALIIVPCILTSDYRLVAYVNRFGLVLKSVFLIILGTIAVQLLPFIIVYIIEILFSIISELGVHIAQQASLTTTPFVYPFIYLSQISYYCSLAVFTTGGLILHGTVLAKP